MIVTEFRTEDLPVSERFGFWHDMTADAFIPTTMSSDHRDDFRATLRTLDFGAIQVSSMTYPPLETLRTAKLIRRSDPEHYQVVLTLRGAHRLTQVGRDTTIGPGDLTLYDSSRVFHGRIAGETGSTVAAAAVAQFPKALLPLPSNRVDRLIAERISARTGIGVLFAQFLVRVSTDATHLRPSDGPRLGDVLFDLLVALLAHELDADDVVPPETHRRALLLRIQAFIRGHIGEPALGPATIAAAHHISVRHLHRLFQDEGVTVVGWIRARRLEGCRSDLADPAQGLVPIHEIALRWGFGHPAAFSRTFRAAYGLSPREYRRHALTRAPLGSPRKGAG